MIGWFFVDDWIYLCKINSVKKGSHIFGKDKFNFKLVLFLYIYYTIRLLNGFYSHEFFNGPINVLFRFYDDMTDKTKQKHLKIK